MTEIACGLLYPARLWNTGLSPTSMTGLTAQNAATDKAAMIGRVYIDGRAASKTMGGGSSAISVRLGTTTFAAAAGATTIDVGIQDVDAASGPPGQPDGTFDCKATLVSATDTLTTAAWNTIAIPSGAGTKTISQGQLIAVVFDMTARGGADSLVINVLNNVISGQLLTNVYDAAAWGTGSELLPNVLLTFSDGTIGTLDGGGFFTASTPDLWDNGDNPDERGNIFQVPFDCKVDALWANCGVTDADTDFTLTLYSDPTGTPTVMGSGSATVSVNAQIWSGTAGNLAAIYTLPSEVSLTANTDYCVAMKADGATDCRLHVLTVNDAAHWALFPGGTTVKYATRNNGAGAFGTTTTKQVVGGVRISDITISSSSTARIIGG